MTLREKIEGLPVLVVPIARGTAVGEFVRRSDVLAAVEEFARELERKAKELRIESMGLVTGGPKWIRCTAEASAYEAEASRLRPSSEKADHLGGAGKIEPFEKAEELPAGKAGGDEFRPGLPPLELRKVQAIWWDGDGDLVLFQGNKYRFMTWPVSDDWQRIRASEWTTIELRPVGKTWAAVELLAAEASK